MGGQTAASTGGLAAAVVALAWAVAYCAMVTVTTTTVTTTTTTTTTRDRCTIQVRESLSCEEFVRDFVGREPVIFGAPLAAENAAFVRETSLGAMRARHADLPVHLSTANAHTGRYVAGVAPRQAPKGLIHSPARGVVHSKTALFENHSFLNLQTFFIELEVSKTIGLHIDDFLQ